MIKYYEKDNLKLGRYLISRFCGFETFRGSWISSHCWRNLSKKMQRVFVIIKKKRIESYLLQLKLQEHHFIYLFVVIINCFRKFITLAFIRPNSSYYQLIELFKSKETSTDLANNLKTAWPRMRKVGFVSKFLKCLGSSKYV